MYGDSVWMGNVSESVSLVRMLPTADLNSLLKQLDKTRPTYNKKGKASGKLPEHFYTVYDAIESELSNREENKEDAHDILEAAVSGFLRGGSDGE